MEEIEKSSAGFTVNWMAVGQRIKNVRKRMAINQIELAQRAGLKSSRAISALEGITGPENTCTTTVEKLAAIARACGVSLDWLIFGDQEDATTDHQATQEKSLREYGEDIISMLDHLQAKWIISDEHENNGYRDYNTPETMTRCLNISIPLCSFDVSANEYGNDGLSEKDDIKSAPYIQPADILPWGVALQNFYNDVSTAHAIKNPTSAATTLKNAVHDLSPAPLSSYIEEDRKSRAAAQEAWEKEKQQEWQEQQKRIQEGEDIPF